MELPLFIDYEASSLHEGSYPIEVGVAMADGSSLSWLIRPEPGWNDWDPVSESVHKIPLALLQREGRGAREVAYELNARFARKVLYCDGLPYDSYWQQRLFEAAGFSAAFELRSVASLLDPAQRACWQAVRDAIAASEAVVLHRADNDARLLQQTWRRLRAQRGRAY
ncbi:hypothetical protein [Aestuariirhabdus litorea]|uniref:Uncharacterized protein n=1 Tax=Aestuariirhabdus litorea TaxID=2528527 RepID=A0A3P3VSX0_9GAMM|nr:hypothetical protein [Aestuariirhabdus litorea]RRJ83873.1 hypothetical protein D0544_01780 [Aestuariirhabdus litorea]RWW97096.1 hypothetical protein DZC74_01780 [Endozoicomonadaceae bacterium GTF-13]